MLINVKMPTFVGILTFMSRINFVLSLVEHGKSFYNLGARLKLCEYKNCRMRVKINGPALCYYNTNYGSKQNTFLAVLVLLSCRVTVTSCFVHNVIRDI